MNTPAHEQLKPKNLPSVFTLTRPTVGIHNTSLIARAL